MTSEEAIKNIFGELILKILLLKIIFLNIFCFGKYFKSNFFHFFRVFLEKNFLNSK